jgi:signal transduction histidine kinase
VVISRFLGMPKVERIILLLSKFKSGFVILWIWWLSAFSLHAQNVSDASLKAAYTFRFAQYIEWPNENIMSSFVIFVYGDNAALLHEFREIARVRTIKNIPIVVKQVSDLKIVENSSPNILFVEKNFQDDLPRIFEIIGRKPVLVVTDESSLKDKLMINFIYTDPERTRISFELNRNAIEKEHQLVILPRLLLLGGTKVDVTDLYQKQEEQLKDERERAERFFAENERQQAIIASQQNEIAAQRDEISAQRDKILLQQKQIDDQQSKLMDLRLEVSSQQALVAHNLEVIANNKAEIANQQRSIVTQNSQVELHNKTLARQNQEIIEQRNRIESQRSVLAKQENLIKSQQRLLYMSIAAAVLAIGFVILIWVGYRNKQKANRLLEQKSSEIERQKREIQLQAELLDHTNKELERHNMDLEEIVMKRTEEYRLAKEKAEESDNLKSAFLANMSHEIRTPLNAIVGFSELLTSEKSNNVEPKSRQFYDIIRQSSNDLLRLIDDIIDIAKIESAQLQIYRKECDVNSDLLSIFHTYRQLLDADNTKREVELRLKIQDDDNALVLNTDPHRLKQIIVNLLNNAMKFTNSGFIEFGYNVSDSGVEFYVEDTGIGIPEEHHGAIFQRFRKLNLSPERFYSGTGLGLAISKSLVEMLGGKIWFNSQPSKGTRFTFTLPKVERTAN